MVVKVHALFSKNNLIGSRIISAGTKHLCPKIKDVPSHVAILVNNRWVHESTVATGIRVITYKRWLEINKEVDKVPLKDIEYSQLANHFRELKGKKYDKLGLIFFALAIIPTFLNFKLTKINKWESSNKYFCSETLGKLLKRYFGMHSPGQILEELKYG